MILEVPPTASGRLAGHRVVAWVGFGGGSHDSALAEIPRLHTAELVCNRGPWLRLDDLHWPPVSGSTEFNHRRLFHDLGCIPPAESEADHCRQTESPPAGATCRNETASNLGHPRAATKSRRFRMVHITTLAWSQSPRCQ